MFSRNALRPHRQAGPKRRPRGITVVLLLGLIAITLAVSYATLRGQGTTTQLARNNSRALDARVAAQSGLAAALRKMSENGWTGIGTPLNANVTNSSWYEVSYATGDPKLTPTDPQYGEYPFRVTIDATGYAADPNNTSVRALHRSRCVVQLVRKKLLAEPPTWSTLTASTVYQYSNRDVYVQFPVRINGSATLLGKLYFCTEYPGVSGPRDQYLSDLYARRLTLGDYRPFPEDLKIRGSLTTQDQPTMDLLRLKLLTPPVDPLTLATMPSHPGTVTQYRLYPGGQPYDVPVLQQLYGSSIQNATLGPDPVNNPLGVFCCDGSLNIQGNVQITGTIITDSSGGSDIEASGTNIVLKPYNMPGLYGSSDVYQLPTLMALNDFRINPTADIKLTGTVMVWDEFELKAGASSMKFGLTGNLATSTLLLRGRTPWVQTPAQWTTDKTNFALNLFLSLLDPNRVPYFPDYEEKNKGFVVKPALTFSPDSSGVKPHYHNWSQPVYQPDPSDPGLRWEVVRWEDNL
jgi:hypothetical protein